MLTYFVIKHVRVMGDVILGRLRGHAGVKPARMRGLAVLAALLSMAVAAPMPASAQVQPLLTSSYITPFPQTDRYQLQVIGDWLGSGLASGLQEAFKQDNNLQIANSSKSSYGLARSEQTDLMGDVDRLLNPGPVHIAVVMLGVNDKLSIRTANSRLQPGTQEWKDAYGREAEKLIKKLKAANVAVYWVGLPIMSNPSFNETVAGINDAVRQAAYLNGVKFIETWTGFTDQLGAYSAFGPDLTGQSKRLREGDGIGFTGAGNRKLANYVEILIRRDLVQAKAQRNIPLAGDEEEQARVVPPAPGSPAKTASASGNAPSATASKLLPQPAGDAAQDRGKPASGKTPAQSANGSPGGAQQSAADSSRQDQAAFSSGYQQGEMILSDIGNGLTAIAVISPVNEFSIRDIQRQTPLADRLYFKVLSKGDALPPKEGRADDFQWRDNSPSKTQ